LQASAISRNVAIQHRIKRGRALRAIVEVHVGQPIPQYQEIMMAFDANALKAEALKVVGRFQCSPDCTVGGVAAALLSATGQVFTGISIETACSLGFCAEHSAVAEMLKQRQTRIVAIVAVRADGSIIAPCGRCRELFHQIDPANWDSTIVLDDSLTMSLRELLPYRKANSNGPLVRH
jgi:cytidine deaminase